MVRSKISKIDKYVLIIILLFFVLLSRLINRDFYSDEIYTLYHFVYTPLHNTIFEYQQGGGGLNNHFLFSVMMNLYVKLIHVDFTYLLNHPLIIRLPMVLFAIVTMYYINKLGGWVAVLLLCTTLPYYYYVTAVRGYSLSIMLIIMLFYYLQKGEVR